MAAPLPFAESEVRLLQALLKARVRFMVVGLSAATLQGAPVVTQNVDLWFEDLTDPNLASALRAVGAAHVPPGAFNPPMPAGEGAELFDVVLRMDGLDTFATELAMCVSIPLGRQRLKVLSLERILASKVAADRPKDRLSIHVIRDAIAAATAIAAPKKNPSPTRRSKPKNQI